MGVYIGHRRFPRCFSAYDSCSIMGLGFRVRTPRYKRELAKDAAKNGSDDGRPRDLASF